MFLTTSEVLTWATTSLDHSQSLYPMETQSLNGL